MRLELWLRRLALLLLPGPFRDRFGDDLAGDVEALAGEARAGGWRRRTTYLGRELLDLVRLSISLRRGRAVAAGPGLAGASMPSLFVDQCRSAARHARRRPAFTAAITGTIAIAIAAATTAAGLAAAVLWRELPFTHASRLVFVWEEVEQDGQPAPARVTGARHAAWRDAGAGFESMALFGAAGFTLESDGTSTSIRGLRVSATYFETLGIEAALGRAFTPEDERPGGQRVVVLSHALWQERFGGREEAVGGTLRLSGEPYTVVGVMPPVVFPAWPVNPASVTLDAEFRQFWVPIARTQALDASARAHVFGVVARLARGVSPSEAADRLNVTSDPAAPDPHRARLAAFREQLTAGARAPLLSLTGAALAVLLIACTNLAALFISGFESRRGEMSVRIAIGATASRLAMQLALEALFLASAGALAGTALAGAALRAAPAFLPASFPLLREPAVDLPLVLFASGLAAGAAVMLAGWPVIRMMMAAPSPRGTAPSPRASAYRALIVSQVGVTMALVAAAGLLAQSRASVERQHPGFALERVLVADVGLPAPSPADGARLALAEQELLATVARSPGVRAAAAAYDHPLEANWSENPTILGDETAADQRQPVELRIVSPGYFEALEVELLDGRTLTARDALGRPGAVVVNEAFARQIGGRILGRRIRSGTPRFMYASAPEEFEIVGIVSNERVRGLEQSARPAYYLSTRQFPQPTFSLLVRTAGDPLAAAADVRTAVRAVDPAITFDRVTTVERILSEQLLPRRVTTDIIGGFAVAALALAALGMYGLLSVLIGSRTRDIGVRLAIGASPAAIAREVLGYGLSTAAMGVLIGGGLALLAGRLVRGLLVDVTPQDPATLAAVAAVLLGIAACAGAAPARRAARIDPVTALRPE